jgi:DNA-directed RNA polymerase alpha subunit
MMTDEDRRRRAARVLNTIAKGIFEGITFGDRGFSKRTIKELLNCGIDAPERLLFMDEATLKSVPNVGPVSMKEIRSYRAKFLRP